MQLRTVIALLTYATTFVSSMPKLSTTETATTEQAGLSKGMVLVPTGGTNRGTNYFRFIIKHEGGKFDFF